MMPVANETVELWQVAHSPLLGCRGSCAGVGRVTTAGVPMKLLPVSWQVAHGAVTTLCFISVTALPEKLVKFVAAWQLSHVAAPIGTWFVGSVFTAGVPLKLRPAA